jgi:hypothetical protein
LWGEPRSPYLAKLSPAGAQAVIRSISLNTDALVAYWEGQIDTAELCRVLKPLPAQQTMP